MFYDSQIEPLQGACMKKNVIIGILMVLLIANVFYVKYLKNEVYICRFETLEQELRSARLYYFKDGLNDLSEIQQHLYEIAIAVKPKNISKFPNRTEKLYVKMDAVFELISVSPPAEAQIPTLMELLDKVEEEINMLLAEGNINDINQEKANEIMNNLYKIEELKK